MNFRISKQKGVFALYIGYTIFSRDGVFAETVTGNGYMLNQVISQINGTLSGNGYSLQQAGQVVGGTVTGNSYQSQGVFGTSVTPTVIPPVVTSRG